MSNFDAHGDNLRPLGRPAAIMMYGRVFCVLAVDQNEPAWYDSRSLANDEPSAPGVPWSIIRSVSECIRDSTQLRPAWPGQQGQQRSRGSGRHEVIFVVENFDAQRQRIGCPRMCPHDRHGAELPIARRCTRSRHRATPSGRWSVTRQNVCQPPAPARRRRILHRHPVPDQRISSRHEREGEKTVASTILARRR